jgi:hypothetical protein
MSEEQQIEPKPTAKKTFKKERKGKFFRDMVGELTLTDDSFALILLTGEPFTGEILKPWSFVFKLKNGKILEKRDCIGAFPKQLDSLLLSRDKPSYKVTYHRNERTNVDKISALDPSLKAGRLRVELVNGWEVEGDVNEIAQRTACVSIVTLSPTIKSCAREMALYLPGSKQSTLTRPPKKRRRSTRQPSPKGLRLNTVN